MWTINKFQMRKWAMIFSLLALCSCAGKDYKETDDSVVVNVSNQILGGPEKVRLQVIDNCIIRVTESPAKTFNDRPSLVVIPQNKTDIKYVVKEKDSVVSLYTGAIQVSVDIRDGRVSFADAGGNHILAESEATKFTPVEVDGKAGYSTINTFSLNPFEGLYGLGQHQSDEWNYRGKREDLYQYNTKVSMPFVISSSNYGILWDSYSLGRFGSENPSAQLNRVFTLFDKYGNEGALTGTYRAANSKYRYLERREDSLFFVDSESVTNLPERFPLSGANVTYEGSLIAHNNGEYTFSLYYAGYIRVFVNDREVVSERWRTAWNPNTHKFSIWLGKNSKNTLRVEWKPDGETSYFGLSVYEPFDRVKRDEMTMWCEMVPHSDYYFIVGDNMDNVVSGLRQLTGKANIMPRWAMGYWQSREHYRTQDELVSILRTFRERGIGIDNIVQDWNYWNQDQWGSHEFDSLRYPDPKAMVDSVHALNAKIMISVWPKFYTETEHFKEFDENKWMYRQAVEDSLKDWVGPGYVGSFYDAYSKEARNLFWNQLKEHLYGYEIDAWWMDATEPNVRDCVPMSYWKLLCGPTALGPSTEYLNAYALMNAKAIYEGLRSEDPDKRVFQLTRSGFLGMQRYSTATWSGDIASRWEDMKSQITAGLNYSLCGNPYWTMDVGGFCVERRFEMAQRVYDRSGVENETLKEWRELQSRWHQFGSFVPLYRSHGQFPYREPWNVAPEDHEAYKSILYYNRLRYRLMPYIYTLAGMSYLNDYTIMRGLIMDFPDDLASFNISDQYMFGPYLMVCPIYNYNQRERVVFLPSDNIWYDFNNQSVCYTGGQYITALAPYNRIPVFVPSGAIIVEGPDVEFTDEMPAGDLRISVFAGNDGYFSLYDDDGVTYGYERGEYSQTPIIFNNADKIVLIGRRRGSFTGMITERNITICFNDEGKIQEKQVIYNGEWLSVKF